jgi:hypothetical protein
VTITTAMAVTFKQELLQASHCFNAAPGSAPTGNTTSASTSVTSMSSLTGISVGQTVTGTGIVSSPATIVAAMPSTSQITLSQAANATNTGVTLTLAGDVFNMALIKSGMAGT